MKCPSCNREIAPSSNKCLYCGINIEMSKLNQKSSKDKNNKNKSLIVLIEIIIIFFIFILYFVLYSKRLGESINYLHELKLIETCEKDYEGKWNEIKKICETEVGNIIIK